MQTETPKKYEIDRSSFIEFSGRKLYRIRALVKLPGVNVGGYGGFIEKEHNLSHEGNSWVFGDAKVYNSARVYDNARVYGKSHCCGGSRIHGDATINDNALVQCYAEVFGHSKVNAYATVSGQALIFGKASLYGNAYVGGSALVGDGIVGDRTTVIDQARVLCPVRLSGYTTLCNDATILTPRDCVTVDSIGSRNAPITFYRTRDNGVSVITGCFNDTLNAFVKAVRERHGGTQHEKEYNLLVEIVRLRMLHQKPYHGSLQISTKELLTLVRRQNGAIVTARWVDTDSVYTFQHVDSDSYRVAIGGCPMTAVDTTTFTANHRGTWSVDCSQFDAGEGGKNV